MFSASALQLDGTLDDGEFALLGRRNDLKLGSPEIFHIIGKKARRIEIHQLVELFLFAAGQLRLVGSKGEIGDRPQIDVAAHESGKLVLQGPASLATVGQSHDVIGDLADIAFSGADCGARRFCAEHSSG